MNSTGVSTNSVQDLDLDSFFTNTIDTTHHGSELNANTGTNLDLDQAINNALAEIDENSQHVPNVMKSSSNLSLYQYYQTHPNPTLTQSTPIQTPVQRPQSQPPFPQNSIQPISLHQVPVHPIAQNGQIPVQVPQVPIQQQQQPQISIHHSQQQIPVQQPVPLHAQQMVKPLSPVSLLSDDSHISSPNNGSDSSQQNNQMINYQILQQQNQDLQNKLYQMKVDQMKMTKTHNKKLDDLSTSMDELKKSEIMRLKLMQENRELKNALIKLTMNDDVC